MGRLTADRSASATGWRSRRGLLGEDGQGLIELLAAMAVLSIALLALLGVLIAGIATIRRGGNIATASALASSQLDLYQALKYSAIALDATAVASTDTAYRSDSAIPGGIASEITTSCPGLPNQCNPSRTVTGTDGAQYRIDTYIVYDTPSGGRAVKLVTVVVRNASVLSSYLVRRVSAFDQSTG